MCGVVDGGIVAGPVRLRGRPVRRRRHLRLVRREPGARRPTTTSARAAGVGVHEHLTALAAEQPIGAHGLVALDWHSGNRSVLVDHDLSGLRRRPDPRDPARGRLPRAARGDGVRHPGHRRDVRGAGVPVTEFVVAGGLLKNALLMQIYADVLDMPLSVVGSEQGPALGSAIHAAVAAGAYPDVPTAAEAMGQRPAGRVHPRSPRTSPAYDGLYAEYRELHDHFGRGASGAMRTLKAHPSGGRTHDRHDAASRRRARHRRRSCAPRSPTCTPSWSATAWSSGPPATSRPGCPARDLLGHQAVGRLLRRARRRRRWSSATSTATSSRATARPSSDTAAHAYVYRHMPDVGGVVHTHSTYATAWAARGEPIPCVLTMMADEFGGEIPVGPFALIGDDSIGRGIVETLQRLAAAAPC